LDNDKNISINSLINVINQIKEKKKNKNKDYFQFQDKKITIYQTENKIIAYTDNMHISDTYKLKDILYNNYEKTIDIKNSKNGFIIPKEFTFNKKGLWITIIKTDKEGQHEEHINISDKWIFIRSKVFSKYYDKFQYEIEAVDPTTGKSIIELCSADTLGKWNLCISFLMNSLGIVTDEACKRYLTRYFKEFLNENKNNDNMGKKVTSPYMGWNENCTAFYPYSNNIHLDFTGDTSNYLKNLSKAFNTPKRARANEKEYIEKLKFITKSKDSDFIISSFFAAPLLKILGLRSFTMNFYGSSKTLKSLSSYFGMSIFGNPEKLKSTGEDTSNSNMEKLAKFHNLPMYLDEIKELEKAINIYCIGNESSRHRLNQYGMMQEKKTWRTICICSSEHSLYTDNSKAGEVNRLICIPVNCFSQLPLKNEYLEEFSRNNYKFLENNYGLLGKKYINTIITQKSKLEQIFKYILDNIKNLNKSNEYRYMIAICATANYIYRKIFFNIDSIEYSVDLGNNILNKTENIQDLDENVKMFNCVYSFYEVNQSNFIIGGIKPRNKTFGEVKNNKIYFLLAPLKEHLTTNGFVWNKKSQLEELKLIEYKNARIEGCGNSKRVIIPLYGLQSQEEIYQENEREGIKK
jgi:uncharacterized protein (DUF927 family)